MINMPPKCVIDTNVPVIANLKNDSQNIPNNLIISLS